MKKRLLTIATCIMFGSLCAFGLSACGDKHEHSYTSVVTNPTCTEQGYTTHTCDCGESYVDTYVEALGHSFTNYVVDANSATYEADGTKTAKCDRCDVTDTITDVGSRLKGTITLVYGNGQQNKVITEYKGTAIPAEADPVREGYTFTGWSTAIPATMGEGSTTITAGWAINQYTITLVYGNGTANKEIKQDYGTAIGVQADPTKTGYTFAGWNKEIPATMPAENLEITAQWDINQYSIIIVLGNGEENVEIKKDYNAQITETLPATLNRTGYTFAGWDKEMPATMPVDGLTITANWTINQYEMRFVLGNGEEDVVIKKDYNSAFTTPVPEKVGYTFAGWSATVPETIPAEDLTFTAQWTINQYSIIIVLDNGEENVEIKKDYNAEITETLPADLEKTGYTFAGWDKELPATMPVDGLTITAKWTINQYTITIVYGNGDPNGEITQDYNSAITTVLEAPVRNNYVFKGWDKELPATMPVDGLTITAIWAIDVSGDPIAIEQAYVSDEDDTVVVDSLGDYNASSFAEMMIGETIIDKTDYSVVDNKLVLAQNLIDEYLGTYQVVYVIDNLDNLIKVDVLFVNKVLKNAQDVEDAFDYGDHQLGAQLTKNTNSYVLADDIDMDGHIINNRVIAAGATYTTYVSDGNGGYVEDKVTSSASDIGFGGIFDGRGYSISNITVEMVNHSLGQHLKADGSAMWINAQGGGLFVHVLEGAQIKNVAFLNVYGKGAVSNNFGLNGLLGITCAGTVENVLFDASINNIHARGPFAQYGATTVLKNVVVNYPKADYTIESHLESAKKPAGGYYDTYAYGYGALSGHSSPMARYAKYENVFVASPMPINLYKAAGSGYAGITSVTYAENETDLRVLFDYEEGTTIAEAIEAEKEIIEQNKKTYQVAGVRRYNDLTVMAQDTEYVQTLIDTGLFKIAEGKLLWHSQKIAVEVTETVEFDAYEGKLLTSMLDGQNIVSANVNGSSVQYVDGKLVGVPELNNLNSLDQRFVITVETEEKAYTFTNVTYWASIINDQNELKAALDYDYSVDNKNNFAFLKLGNPVDIDKSTWTEIDYTDLKNASRSTQKPDTPASGWNGVAVTTGFAGVFDGCGYAINFNATGVSGFGIFGALATGAQVGIKQPATIKNVAFLEYSKNWSPVIAQYGTTHTYNKGVLIENVYVTWLKNAVQAGLIYEPNAGNVIRNVMVNVENNVEFGKPVAEGKLENMSAGYYGGTLYSNLRRAGYILNLTDNFVSLGKGELAKQSNGIATTQYEKWFKTTANGDGTYTHALKHGGWSGNPFSPYELYLAYASNKEYGDTTINKGMKAGFAEIAKNYANGAAIAGYYCATCGETFSLTAGNCDKCEGEVALTESANLWREAISYKWELTKLSEVNNANASSTGEVVLAGAYKYNSTAEMKASGNTFASFVGEAGNNMWAVNDGVLTWVGAQA